MWLSVHQCNKPVLHDAGPDVCTIDSPCLPQKPCGRHWYWSDTGCCLLPLLPSHHQPHYSIGTLSHALHQLHLHLSFHLQSWKNNYNVTWTMSIILELVHRIPACNQPPCYGYVKNCKGRCMPNSKPGLMNMRRASANLHKYSSYKTVTKHW